MGGGWEKGPLDPPSQSEAAFRCANIAYHRLPPVIDVDVLNTDILAPAVTQLGLEQR